MSRDFHKLSTIVLAGILLFFSHAYADGDPDGLNPQLEASPAALPAQQMTAWPAMSARSSLSPANGSGQAKGSAAALNNQQFPPSGPNRQKLTLFPGTPILVQLETPIATDANRVGDPLQASLVQDYYMGPNLLLPRLTRFYGHIATMDIALAGRNPILAIRFDRLQLPTGEWQAMQAAVRTERPDHTWGGELTEGTKPKIVRHGVMGIGYYNQVIMSGPRKLGTPIRFLPGTMWTLLLKDALTLGYTPTVKAPSFHKPWP